MNRYWNQWPRLGTVWVLSIAAVASLTSVAAAQEKKAATEAQPAKPAAVKRAEAGGQPVRVANQVQPAGQQPNDFVGPPVQGGPVKPATTVKPGTEIPQPTVILKPGEVPGIRFDTPIYDFGKVRAGPDVEHDYWFTNTGTGPLEILRVKPS